jgi:hypothetical protein
MNYIKNLGVDLKFLLKNKKYPYENRGICIIIKKCVVNL